MFMYKEISQNRISMLLNTPKYPTHDKINSPCTFFLYLVTNYI
jgi:hypothetical protein